MKQFYFFFSLSISLFVSSVSQGQIYVKQDAVGMNDGSSWTNAYTDLNDALTLSAPNDQIWVAAGTYKPGGNAPTSGSFYTFPHDLELYGGFSGTETMLSERDWLANETILSGDHAGDDIDNDFSTNKADNSLHVMMLTDTVTTASAIDGFTIRNGNTQPASGSGDARRGGGILTYGEPAIRNCRFTQNYGYFGGGFYPRGGDDNIVIESCLFENNSGGFGAGVYINAVTATIDNCSFLNNSVATRGGALYNNTEGGSIIINCTFNDNTALDSRGGGIYNTSSPSSITNCTFDNNSAPGSSGGALQIRSDDDEPPVLVSVTECSFNSNSATFGGAVGVYDQQSVGIFTDCSFTSNSAVNVGGGATNAFGAASSFTDCTFSENTASINGGALFSQNDSALVNFINCEISFNTATERGGAFYIGSDNQINSTIPTPMLTIENTIIQGNSCDDQGGAINLDNSNAAISNTLISNNFVNSPTGLGGGISINTSDSIHNTVDIINTTIANNISVIGAGISHFKVGDVATSVLILQNTLLMHTIGNNYEVESGTPTVTSSGGNLSSDNSMVSLLVGTNDLNNSDPLFENFNSADYHLKNDSPCVDAGIDAGAPLLDLDGLGRVDGVDIGAYENQKLVSVFNLPASFGQLDVFPNPIQKELNFSFESPYTGSLQVRITDTKGALILEQVLEKNNGKLSHAIDLEKLPAGMYQLTVSNGAALNTVGFVK